MKIGTAYVARSNDGAQEQCTSIFTPTQTKPRVQQLNPGRMETSNSVNAQRTVLLDNNKPAPTRITLHTTHL
jgi:hypothetical protein